MSAVDQLHRLSDEHSGKLNNNKHGKDKLAETKKAKQRFHDELKKLEQQKKDLKKEKVAIERTLNHVVRDMKDELKETNQIRLNKMYKEVDEKRIEIQREYRREVKHMTEHQTGMLGKQMAHEGPVGN
eukprot:TRINITY_DN3842_c0_g1_i2.p4 TRINITY_DN3842_c0_g1~~TRINITY_DN3842_c0_g1_i2.p4  ORF type:complete len:128 (-),score=20.39 TRINITY_DN3842_c0_g1_i2:209-592(-)